MEDSTAEETKSMSKKNLPPTVITVDTANKDAGSEESRGESDQHRSTNQGRPPSTSESETRTPKHANKAMGAHHDGGIDKNTSIGTDSNRGQPNFFPSRPFEGRIGGPTGAFEPHDSATQQHHSRLMGMQVSPNSGRYYASFGPGRYPNAYDQRTLQEYTPASQRMPGYGQPNMPSGMYPPPHQFPPGFNQRPWVPPHAQGPSFQGRPPPYHSQGGPMVGPFPPNHGPSTNNNGTFSRAVSSSFDRSIKSRSSDDRMVHNALMEPSIHMANAPHARPPSNGSVSDDGSWRQLNQIKSVDEEEIRKRLDSRKGTSKGVQDEEKNPDSNSSSLTNSPTDGVDHKKLTVSEAPKMPSSLDSLSSVASAQEPIDTSKLTEREKQSPDIASATGSLDLMKCSSGSSNLLLPAHHQRIPSLGETQIGDKRGLDEQRGDLETMGMTTDVRKAPPDESRPAKRGRLDGSDEKKPSPLSISCSPPHDGDKHEGKGTSSSGFYAPTSRDSFYEKAPNYSYSMESAPAMPKDGLRLMDGYPPLPPRPNSSASSTVTPMQIVVGNERNAPHPGVTQLPSWELQAQDSFGAGSHGERLMSNFSFGQDYPVLSQSNSAGNENNAMHMSVQGPVHMGHERNPALESRNQSFEGGHYHGSFNRTESMSFESRGQGIPDARQGYHHYPPQAPSWGSAGSYPQASGYPTHYRMGVHPIMMRTFSQESDPRGLPPGFQPPSEFQAPPSNLNKNRPRTEKHLMSTPYAPSKTGVFGWTKEEDMRLTDIMKKYKNPRDWEPIAKELDRGRTAKECFERWIRYLKPGVRKGQWTDQEDAIVMEAVSNSKEQPFTRWSDLAQRLPGRVGKQIRDRWVNHLNPNINHLPFSRDDDLLLWEGHQKLGKRWVEIATKFFKSSRSENHIKNRWYSASFKKFISNEFGPHAYSGTKSPRSPTKKDSPKKKGKPFNVPSSPSSSEHDLMDDTPTFSVDV